MAYSFRERLAVTTLVHVVLGVLVPSQAGQTWAITFSVSVVLFSAAAWSRPEEVEGSRERSRGKKVSS